MASLASLYDARSYHILAYGTLLGSTFFQSFIAGPVAFKAIPRSAFATLQTHVTPVFFGLQTALPIIMALTYPGSKVASVGAASIRSDAGALGLLDKDNLYTALIPVSIMIGTAVINLLVLGPMTTRTMKERKHQETRDGKKSHDPGPKSAEMQRLNKKFGALHGSSAMLDLAGLLAMMFYGVELSSRL